MVILYLPQFKWSILLVNSVQLVRVSSSQVNRSAQLVSGPAKLTSTQSAKLRSAQFGSILGVKLRPVQFNSALMVECSIQISRQRTNSEMGGRP